MSDNENPYTKRDRVVEERKQQHRDHIQDIYNKTHKVVKDRLDEFEERQKLTV